MFDDKHVRRQGGQCSFSVLDALRKLLALDQTIFLRFGTAVVDNWRVIGVIIF
jgi:hypothetical protein